jgi:type II secretory ATPase GspE/PulE/Tfp pilus assembly ATPase PilB-like protein
LATVLAEGFFLVSFWKPLPLVLTIGAWGWVISTIYDKHAARFHLPRRQWNIVHMVAGLLAIAAYLLMPVKHPVGFLVSWAASLAILAADLGAYAMIANKDERVPERFKIRLDLRKLREASQAKKAAKLQAKVALVLKSPDEKGKLSVVVAAPQADTPEYAVRVAAEALYLKALQARASQIDIGPAKDNTYGVSLLIDGVRQPGEAMPAADALKIMDLWKGAAKLDVSDRRRRLQGNVGVEQEGAKHTLRITSIGVQGGMRLTVLIDPEQAVSRKLADLGLLDPQAEELKAIAAEEKGVVLLASPPDGGRTTTFYSVLGLHDAYTKNVQSVEADPQASVEGIRLNKFDADKEGAEYSTTVRSVLRRDPDVVGVAELMDANTAKEIAKADQERTRTYVSLKADGALAAVQMWVKAVGDPKQAADVLHGVLAQKLVRRLCANCRAPYPPTADLLKKLGIPEGKVQQLFKKGGQVLIKNKPEVCPACAGLGFRGQDGIFEVYRIGPEEREMIVSGNFAGLRAQFRKRGLPTIQQSAIRKVVDGITSVEEVMRVTAEGGAGTSGGGSGGPPPAGGGGPAPAATAKAAAGKA